MPALFKKPHYGGGSSFTVNRPSHFKNIQTARFGPQNHKTVSNRAPVSKARVEGALATPAKPPPNILAGQIL
jgi:hypothetical protein